MDKKQYTIEIATTDFATTAAAVAGGADRIELCSALSEGGLTPSYGLVRRCRAAFGRPLFPILRPRSGDFLYTEEEYAVIQADARLCREVGCEGIVTGFLNRDGSIDQKRIREMVALVYPLEVTFHRAFDRCRDPFEALEQLIEAGCQRILTSGQQPAAPQGAPLIAQLVEKAADRIVIMPGSGVRPDNILQLARQTGATEFHSSLKSTAKSGMDFVHPSFAGSAESYSVSVIHPSDVQAMRQALDGGIEPL